MVFDSNTRWKPFPSIIDGVARGVYVSDRGHWEGSLNLVISQPRQARAFAVEVPCEVFGGCEEMIYGLAYANASVAYDGGVYIKEAETSVALEAFRAIDPFDRAPRHFCFLGEDYCYEVVGFGEPQIRVLADPEDATRWKPPAD